MRGLRSQRGWTEDPNPPGLGGSRTWMIADSGVQGVAYFTLQTCISRVLAGFQRVMPTALSGQNERNLGCLWE